MKTSLGLFLSLLPLPSSSSSHSSGTGRGAGLTPNAVALVSLEVPASPEGSTTLLTLNRSLRDETCLTTYAITLVPFEITRPVEKMGGVNQVSPTHNRSVDTYNF